MLHLDAICMNLIALGEAVKGLDKITKGELLVRYPEIYWSGVMKMRDKIAHHYFEMDAEVVYKIVERRYSNDVTGYSPDNERYK